MRASELIINPSSYDLNQVVADIDAIRQHNLQRFECEQLSAIVLDELDRIVGYKDITPDEFWVRGHMPGRPLMPGVLICEAAAQLCSYHAQRHDLSDGKVVGLGSLADVRFVGVVPVPSRLVIAAQVLKVRRGILVAYRFQVFVDNTLTCHGELRGIGLPAEGR